MDRVLAFIIGVPVGLLIIIYREPLKRITGNIDFAENYLGSGGTYTLFILIGILVMFFSVSYAFGALQDFIVSNFSPFL